MKTLVLTIILVGFISIVDVQCDINSEGALDDLDLDLVIKITSDGLDSELKVTPEMLEDADNESEELDEELLIVDGYDTDDVTDDGLKPNEEMIDDMVVTEDVKEWLISGADETESVVDHGNRTKRAGHMHPPESMFWKNGIVAYRIEMSHFRNKVDKELLREAMDVWEEVACVKFEEKNYMHPTYIYFIHTDRGCFSHLGMQPARGPQRLSLQEPGCRHFGTYLHEMGHALGLVHEHQLPTRSNFVNYFMTNVDPLKKSQLELYKPGIIKTYDTPYDLGSIMHYDLISFSVDDVSPTLGVDNPWLFQHIGRRYSNMVSFGDARTVNKLYQCHIRCDNAKQQACGFPNYLDKDCDCVSPQSYDLKYCRDTEGMEAFCAGLVPSGRCDIKNIEHHKHCRRSCDFCPRFFPGESAIGPKQTALGKTCVDRYRFPQKCQQWKALCGQSRWMHRNCRRTCNVCTSKWGDCPNYDPDNLCDKYMELGHCKSETKIGTFIRTRCQDSCDTCGHRKEDLSCRNVVDDTKCKLFAKANQCEKNPEQMFEKCASTCNRCYFNKGECANKASAFQCQGWGLQNFCKGGDPLEMQQVRGQCGKTCDSC